jgi:hypothetical protein
MNGFISQSRRSANLRIEVPPKEDAAASFARAC